MAVSVKYLTNKANGTLPIGLYLHIPFCEKKCAYCDFYSSFLSEDLMNTYVNRLISAVKQWGGIIDRPINTIYLGGGTPSLLGERIMPLLSAVRESFCVTPNCEITMEINPSHNISDILYFAKQAGVNRLSIGAQSGDDDELKLLGRTHSAKDTENAVAVARKFGFDNISLDIMLGLPFSTLNSLEKSLNFITSLEPEHISAYILKIEENTHFYHNRNSLSLPNDDLQAEQYLLMCNFLKEKGYKHYEISNFCKTEKESRHNLKYWHCEDYIGIGPAAHSFLDKKRFYYPRDIKAFINGNSPIPDGDGGDKAEYIMLNLRLCDGVDTYIYKQNFGEDLPQPFYDKCRLFKKAGLINFDNSKISLTDSGMIVSNSIISELLECIE